MSMLEETNKRNSFVIFQLKKDIIRLNRVDIGVVLYKPEGIHRLKNFHNTAVFVSLRFRLL